MGHHMPAPHSSPAALYVLNASMVRVMPCVLGQQEHHRDALARTKSFSLKDWLLYYLRPWLRTMLCPTFFPHVLL